MSTGTETSFLPSLFPEDSGVTEASPYRVEDRYAEIRGADVHYRVWEPKVRTSEESTLIVPGYLGLIEFYEDLAASLAMHGEQVIGFKPVSTQHLPLKEQWNALNHPHQLLAETAIGIIKTERLEEPDLAFKGIGYSMGGISAVEAAVDFPEAFKNLILLASAGLEAGLHTAKLALRIPGVLKELNDHNIPHSPELMVSLGRYAMNPRRQLEGWKTSNSYMVPTVRKLKKVMDVGILHAEDDPFYPKEFSAHLRCESGVIEKAGHLAPTTHPEATAIAIRALWRRFSMAKDRYLSATDTIAFS
jgi:pimeloyl-ACP methyl ester carboxylesterase